MWATLVMFVKWRDERIQRRWIMQITGMADARHGEPLQALRLFSVYGRLLRGNLIKIWQVFHPRIDLGLGNLFDRQSHGATRSNGFKLTTPRCRSEIHRRFGVLGVPWIGTHFHQMLCRHLIWKHSREDLMRMWEIFFFRTMDNY